MHFTVYGIALHHVLLPIIIAYLLGGFPTGYLVGRMFYGTDIRTKGSGNIGATNALRSFGTGIGLVVLLVDLLKGAGAILLARVILPDSGGDLAVNLVVCLSGLAVILGHVFPVWLRFKGGKGVATAAGVFIILMPLTVLIVVVLFVFVVAMTRYVSLGSLLAAIGFFLIELFTQLIYGFPNLPQLFLVLIVVSIILYMHRANIGRLLEGTENKISFRHKSEEG